MKPTHVHLPEPIHPPWAERQSEAMPFGERIGIAVSRAQRWEFWPAWLYYLPIIAKILSLGIQHRSATVFTAANPGIRTGGLVGEAKSETLVPLAEHAPDMVASFALLPQGTLTQRERVAQAFVEAHGLPCVLKPNVGQRGRGVYIARSVQAIRDYLSKFTGELIIQRYVGGEEFGVFIAAHPGTDGCEILSIVNKAFPSVMGDGRTPLRQLILADERARLMAPSLFHRWSGKLDEIIPKGKALQLVDIGAHCRGSLFLDASSLASPELVAQMRRLTSAVPGFHFGRIDLRVPDANALQAGQGIQVLEINGVGAESAHIYHPDTPLMVGYQAMFRQWEIAFEIGAHNARQGAQPTRVSVLLKGFLKDLRAGKRWF